MLLRDFSPELRKQTACALGLICGLEIVLLLFARTPRARLNVAQMAAVVFLTTVLLRFLRSGRPRKDAPEQPLGSAFLAWLGVVFGALVWGTMLTCYFVSDDFGILYLSRPPLLHQVKFVFLETNRAGAFYRPLTYSTYFLDHALWDRWPAGYHLTNLLLHAAAIGGLFVLLRQLGVGRQTAAITCSLFAAMPIQAEAVGWMSGRFDVLSATLTIWAAACYVRSSTRNNPIAYPSALMLYALSIISKETGFVLPLLLIAIDVIMFRTRPDKKIIGFVAAGGVLFLYRSFALGGLGGYKSAGISSAVDVTWRTFEGLLIRAPSQLLLGLNWTQPSGIWVVSLAAVMATTFMWLAVSTRPDPRRSALIMFAFIWMVVTAVPAHFLTLIGPGLSNSRILYSPSVGMAMVLGQLIAGMNTARIRNLAAAGLFVFLNLGLLHNLAAWRWTSQLAKDTLEDVTRLAPLPASQTQFVFSNLPDSIRGVFFFRVGLTESIRMAYGRDDISAVRDSDIAIPPNILNARPQIRLYWKGEESELLVRRE